MNEKLILFGTGKLAKKYTEFFKLVSINIDGYIDNNKSKWGTYFYNKKIYGPEVLYKIEKPAILIACTAKEEILQQLSDMNLKKYIVSVYHIINSKSKITISQTCNSSSFANIKDNKTIIIDNLNGSWGGAEDWVHIVASSLIARKRNVYVIENKKQPYISGLEKNILRVDIDEESGYPLLAELIEFLVKKKPFILFNVRYSELLWMVSALKVAYPNDVFIISSILNDTIYKDFCEWKEIIDLYLCISSRIQRNIFGHYGIDKKKICCRTPFIENIRKINKTYQSQKLPLRIGYPCRLTYKQKRADLLPDLIMHLEKKGLNYLLNIAGDGSCEKLIKQYVENKHLNGKVKFYGRLSRVELFDFLDHQDIYLNFSEYEGTSLTMLEAMASGCVPIVTNVSGVSDFIENKINGLIANVGDLEKICEYIVFLDKNRQKLVEYGMKCMHVVQEKCNLDDYIDEIEDIIDSVQSKRE